MSFNERLRQLRQERGLTVYRLARLSGVTKQALSRLEGPNSNPTLATLYKLAKALGVSIHKLIGEEKEKGK